MNSLNFHEKNEHGSLKSTSRGMLFLTCARRFTQQEKLLRKTLNGMHTHARVWGGMHMVLEEGYDEKNP
jgi:hypothetical protein